MVYIPLVPAGGLCPKCQTVALIRGFCEICCMFWHIGVVDDEEMEITD